jgi:hypothetical protein
MASFIITQNAVLWSKISDSHEVIIKENKIDDTKDMPDFVRGEMYPDDEDYRRPFTDWKFHLDQDKKPDWYSEKYCEEICRKALNDWAVYHVYIDRDATIEETQSLVSYGTSKLDIKTMSGGNARSYDTSKLDIETMSGGKALSCDTSKLDIKTTLNSVLRASDGRGIHLNEGK